MLKMASTSLASTLEKVWRLGTASAGSWRTSSPFSTPLGVPCATKSVPFKVKSPVAVQVQSGCSIPMALMLHVAVPEAGRVPLSTHVRSVSGRLRWCVGSATILLAMNENGMDSHNASSPLPMHMVNVLCVDAP